MFSSILLQISDDDTSTVAHQEGESAQDLSGWLMTSWTISIKFSYDNQFIFRSMMFVAGDDGNLELLTRGPTPRHEPVYGQASYLLIDPSTSGRACSGLNPHVGSYYLSVMMSQGYPIGKTILLPLAGASSSSSSRATPDRDSAENYHEIGASACWNPAIQAHRISMVHPARGSSQNSSIKYPTIEGSEPSDAWTSAAILFGI
jgi:hypothetical protein